MSNFSRRDFIVRGTLLGGFVAAGSSFLAACNKDKGGGDAAAPAALSCNDTSKLDDAAKGMRTTLGYVDKSVQAGKNCGNCKLYKAAMPGQCGGCTLLQGPINPEGYCNSWVTAAT